MMSCSVCLSVCLSVTFVCSVKTSNHILKFFLLSGSHAILVAHLKRCDNILRLRVIPLTEASNEGEV